MYKQRERVKDVLLNHLSCFNVDNALASSIVLNGIKKVKKRTKGKQESTVSEYEKDEEGRREARRGEQSCVTEIDRTRVAHTRGKRRRKSSAIKSRLWYTAKLKSRGQGPSPTHVSVLSRAEIRKYG